MTRLLTNTMRCFFGSASISTLMFIVKSCWKKKHILVHFNSFFYRGPTWWMELWSSVQILKRWALTGVSFLLFFLYFFSMVFNSIIWVKMVRTECQLCGKRMFIQALRSHTKKNHEMTISDYKERFRSIWHSEKKLQFNNILSSEWSC